MSETAFEGYAEDLAAIHGAGFTAIADAAARELLDRLEPRSTVVELGCGDGTTARALTDAGHQVEGVDASAEMVALARAKVPEATFRVGSFVDAALPPDTDAVVAIGEVLGYALDARVGTETLDAVIARVASALAPGGLLLFDLAGPGRVAGGHRHTWFEGSGWTILLDELEDADAIERRIVSFREREDGRFSRSEETHRLVLHRPADVLRSLRVAGLSARTLPAGYAGYRMPRGLTVYLARRP